MLGCGSSEEPSISEEDAAALVAKLDAIGADVGEGDCDGDNTALTRFAALDDQISVSTGINEQAKGDLGELLSTLEGQITDECAALAAEATETESTTTTTDDETTSTDSTSTTTTTTTDSTTTTSSDDSDDDEPVIPDPANPTPAPGSGPTPGGGGIPNTGGSSSGSGGTESGGIAPGRDLGQGTSR